MAYDEFLGKGFAFPPRLDAAQGRFVMSAGEDDIKEAIYILLMTRKGERVMLPEYGCMLQDHVFDLPDSASVGELKRDIIQAIVDWEPRVIDPRVDVDLDDIHNGKLVLDISYTVRDTNNPGNLVFPYYLYEGVGLE
jgi:phage baseplate assembly protein W